MEDKLEKGMKTGGSEGIDMVFRSVRCYSGIHCSFPTIEGFNHWRVSSFCLGTFQFGV